MREIFPPPSLSLSEVQLCVCRSVCVLKLLSL